MSSRISVVPVLLAVTVSGCASTTSGTATPATPAASLTTEAGLPTALLSAGEVAADLGSPDIVVTNEVSTPWDHSAQFPAGTDPGCLAIAGAAQRAAYEGSGWTVLRGQVLREPPAAQAWSHFATQAVVLFTTATAASDFFERSRQAWAACSDRELSYPEQPAPEQVWSVGPTAASRDMLTVSRSQRSPQQWSCQRALTVRGNAAVDVEACSLDGPTDAAAAMAGTIGDRLPAA